MRRDWEIEQANRVVMDQMLAHEQQCDEAMLDKMLAMESKIVKTQADAAAQIVAAADILEIQASESKRAFEYKAAMEAEMLSDEGYVALQAEAEAHAREAVSEALEQHKAQVAAGGSSAALLLNQAAQQNQKKGERVASIARCGVSPSRPR